MPDDMTDARRADLEQVWQDYHDGKIEHQAAQSKVLEIARREDKKAEKAPAKKKEAASGTKRRSRGPVDGGQRNSGDAGELHSGELGPRSTGAVDLRARDGTPGRIARPVESQDERDRRLSQDAAWREEDHPRGQPGNPGQFATTSGGSKSIDEPEEPDKPKRAPEAKGWASPSFPVAGSALKPLRGHPKGIRLPGFAEAIKDMGFKV
jgi:hypothetical protein